MLQCILWWMRFQMSYLAAGHLKKLSTQEIPLLNQRTNPLQCLCTNTSWELSQYWHCLLCNYSLFKHYTFLYMFSCFLLILFLKGNPNRELLIIISLLITNLKSGILPSPPKSKTLQCFLPHICEPDLRKLYCYTQP